MLYELPEKAYPALMNRYAAQRQYIEVNAILSLNNPGKIYVRTLDNPDAALIWSEGLEGYYLIGNEDDRDFQHNMLDFIKTDLLDWMKAKNLKAFEISGASDQWDRIIPELLTDISPVGQGLQLLYSHTPQEGINEPVKNEESGHIIAIGRTLLDGGFEGISWLLEKISQFWHNTEAFLADGVGFCYILDNRIVSACLSGSVFEDAIAVDVETVKSVRRRGYAFACASHLFRACHTRGIIPYWECDAGNKPSVCLAEKLGCKKVFEYKLYWFSFS